MFMNKLQRIPVTVRIDKRARQQLRKIHQYLLDHNSSDKVLQLSEGKIIETLLLKEDAQVYVEEHLLRV